MLMTNSYFVGCSTGRSVGFAPFSTSLPAVITVQGVYCFTDHLSTAMTSGHAIDIQTNNVILDLNGFKLGGLAGGLGTLAIGVHAINRQNITIKNDSHYPFSSFFSSFRKRQFVPWAMIFCGLDFSIPTSCKRSA